MSDKFNLPPYSSLYGYANPKVQDDLSDYPMNDYRATGIAEGFIECRDYEEEMKAWQYLVDTGLAWTLQGWFGRRATQLIEEGHVTAAEVPWADTAPPEVVCPWDAVSRTAFAEALSAYHIKFYQDNDLVAKYIHNTLMYGAGGGYENDTLAELIYEYIDVFGDEDENPLGIDLGVESCKR